MFHSRSIKIGNLLMGGDQPVVIQSMTSTDTNDIESSVNQCARIFDAGAGMVRLTTQSLKEVSSLKTIKEELRKRGYDQPLVADVHFQPKVAEEAAKIVEKVRINPGNYIERKYTGPKRYSILEQKKQQEIIRERLIPLIRICKENNTAIRVGVNHGSLSERILNWYGNSPEGMVESAMEFIRVFEEEKFDRLVISLKASNTRQMVYANRLLASRMYEEDFHYPIHLGVTEAGDEDDGRVKSAIGIGTLLADGIGDTIRVSLTEEPEKEIPVAVLLRDHFGNRKNSPDFIVQRTLFFRPYNFKRRISLPSGQTGGGYPPVVISSTGQNGLNETGLKNAGYSYEDDAVIKSSTQSADYIFLDSRAEMTEIKTGLKVITEVNNWKEKFRNERKFFPLIYWKEYGLCLSDIKGLHFIEVDVNETPGKFFEIIDNELFGVLIVRLGDENPVQQSRNFFRMLGSLNILLPVILHKKYSVSSEDELITLASTELGSLLNDGFGDGIWIEENSGIVSETKIREIMFSILQATGTRVSKTEYISCPSCGRTLFNIQAALSKIKLATSGFPGLKIGVMGCIVNGPGEMADADFGYVGAGHGKITLYKGKEAVKSNIPEEDAVEELVKLIKQSGKQVSLK